MQDAVSLRIAAEPAVVWKLVSDVTNTGRFSPETFEAEWLDGNTEPAVGARFRGHVRRNGRGPVYWITCHVTHCVPGREFGFRVGPDLNHWHYRFEPAPEGGTMVTESFRLADTWFSRLYWMIAGERRRRYNRMSMMTTLERVRAVAEGSA